MAEGATNNAALVLKSILPLRQPSTLPPRLCSCQPVSNPGRILHLPVSAVVFTQHCRHWARFFQRHPVPGFFV